jgi:hypothetical protein
LQEALAALLESNVSQSYVTFLLRRDGTLLTQKAIPSFLSAVVVSDIIPGSYTLALDTEWVLWEGELTPRDLIWSLAFPRRPLPLAAKTAAGYEMPTRTIEILTGEVVIQVFAGLERGQMAIHVKGREGWSHDR